MQDSCITKGERGWVNVFWLEISFTSIYQSYFLQFWPGFSCLVGFHWAYLFTTSPQVSLSLSDTGSGGCVNSGFLAWNLQFEIQFSGSASQQSWCLDNCYCPYQADESWLGGVSIARGPDASQQGRSIWARCGIWQQQKTCALSLKAILKKTDQKCVFIGVSVTAGLCQSP